VVTQTSPIDGGRADGALDTPVPTDTPPDGRHVVFVTSTIISGGMPPLGGLAGADALCQSRAKAANLTGTYLAWLAAGAVTPASRMTHHTGPYQLTTGDIIAQGWTDLTDGNLVAKIDRTETRMQSSGAFVCGGGEVWSNVDVAGNLRAGVTDCGGWTSAAEGDTGTAGNVTAIDGQWTASTCVQISCSSPLAIYCIEQ
jgi:hypothetical protein